MAGRPARRGSGLNVPWPSTQTAGFPEYERPRRALAPDDLELLAEMRRSDAEKEELLRRWEADLRRRERDADGGTDEQPPPSH